MTDREIEQSKRDNAIMRLWLRGIVRWGTPSRLVVWGNRWFCDVPPDGSDRQRWRAKA